MRATTHVCALLCAVMLASIGCGTAVLRPYVGEQQAWPTASGSIVINNYQLPIFTSLPPVSYEVIGELVLEKAIVEQTDVDHVPIMVRKAVDLGADALLFVNGKQFFATDYGPRKTEPAIGGERVTVNQVNSFNPTSFQPGVSILAIRWASQPPPGFKVSPKRSAH